MNNKYIVPGATELSNIVGNELWQPMEKIRARIQFEVNELVNKLNSQIELEKGNTEIWKDMYYQRDERVKELEEQLLRYQKEDE